MPKYYLLGGENTHKRDAEEINQRAFNDAGKSPRVIVFSWARASFDRAYPKSQLLFDYFRSLGACSVNTVDYSCTLEEIKEKISETDLIYLTGGVPTVLVERLKKSGIRSLFLDFKGIIVGRSAGALALCRKCIVTCRRTSEIKVIAGLGLVDLTLKAHYRLFKDEKLIVLSRTENFFALPKNSAIVYDNGKLSFINNVYLFCNGEKQTVSEKPLEP
jgi:dipeptidase E